MFKKHESTFNLELVISYGCGLSSPMFVVCRFDRLCDLPFTELSSLDLSADTDLTFCNKLPNVPAMSSNVGNSNELQQWTTQNAQQVSRSNRGNRMLQLMKPTVPVLLCV